ncbi:MAG: ImmA/IrrE family metallo-endopeptidase [Alphaproteobacteria bacterium]|nr:ImmA/IrrE family metallo-endopeptidase [Alphaproteobacteria bacterium]
MVHAPKSRFPSPTPVQMGASDIERHAEAIAGSYGFSPETDSIKELVRTIGGEIDILEFADEQQLEGGSLEVYGPDEFRIYLSPVTSFVRDNFTIAHELGHYFLHSGSPPGSRQISAGRWGTSLVEQQANRFAAALLMPRARFGEVAKRLNYSLPVLAGRFNVSEQAASFRLKSLGMG